MQNAYKRQLIGEQPGVQVNMPVDRTERMLPDAADQIVATAGWFQRGRIDRPFLVTKDKLSRYLGKSKSLRVDARNEVYIQIYEAFSIGAAGAVLSRLKSDEAVHKWVLVKHGAGDDVIGSDLTLPNDESWLLAVKIMDCINEGVFVQIARGTENPEHISLTIRERVKDSKGNDSAQGEILYELEGSLDVEELDEEGNSVFIGNVASFFYGDWLEIEVNPLASKILLNDNYANRKTGSGVLFYEDQGKLTVQDFVKAVSALEKTDIKFRFLLSYGNNLSLHSAMMELGPRINRRVFVEIPGNLSPEAAISWLENFNYGAQEGMYFDFTWSPVSRNDPLGISGNAVFGTIGQKAGYACARNAVTNGYGLSKLNQPIAGKAYFITGTRIKQIYFPDDMERALLAKARINPAVYVEYQDGSGFVWDDCLSGAKKSGISKLSSASEIAIWVQDTWGKYGLTVKNKPMTEALEKMEDFTEKQLRMMQASKWLTPSVNLNGAAYAYEIKPNERYPDDRIDTNLSLSIDGVVRVITISTDMYSRS